VRVTTDKEAKLDVAFHSIFILFVFTFKTTFETPFQTYRNSIDTNPSINIYIIVDLIVAIAK
jgi:hypothetical protein